MLVENIVWDAINPVLLGAFWAQALNAVPSHPDDDRYFEARLDLGGDLWLDLCFPQVDEPSSDAPRLHLDLLGGKDQQAVVERLLGLGAQHLDIGQRDVPWVVLADPEGNALCVMEERASSTDTGPVAAIPIDSADPDRDGAFWAELTGWVAVDGDAPATLRHPSGRGPLLEWCPEPAPKQGKNRVHLDLRPGPSERAEEQLIHALDLGAARVHHDWGDNLPWTVLTDPSGNEFCILQEQR